jgi:hypothetical protein
LFRWLSLQEIYEAIKAKYSFFRSADPAWQVCVWPDIHGAPLFSRKRSLFNLFQNSIRHNLSVNATFTKVPRPADRPGKLLAQMESPLVPL